MALYNHGKQQNTKTKETKNMNKQNYKIKKFNNHKEVTIMKNNKFRRSLVAAIAALAILIGFISTASIPASAREYKVYKNDVTVDFFGERLPEAEFRAIMHKIYDSTGIDATIEFVKILSNSPHSEEWIRCGIDFFVDCYFMQTWRDINGLLVGASQYYIGKGWHEAEGWR
jgi:hypothetical protein